MTITKKYSFDERDPKVHMFFINNSEFVSIEGSRTYIMEHVDETSRDKFQLELSKIVNKFDANDEHIRINIAKYLTETKPDVPLITITPRLVLNALSTTYQDVFPTAFYDGCPIPIHTIDYKRMGFILLWNKNGGTSNHDIRIIKSDVSGNPLPSQETPDVLIHKNNMNSGRSFSFNFPIPPPFINYRGFVKIQAKSGNGTDNPILDALFIYLLRRELF